MRLPHLQGIIKNDIDVWNRILDQTFQFLTDTPYEVQNTL